ncbi:hypothetical protein SARC_10473 [Sphaeroforma arctica JP610]|uniref:Uncharacterized protein n=1 Tax=Sphaeroforma arctica JP610 TaxID=667725 RepID=A0A0L0FJX4_9EUKA|nr:hypothetical protein SARC_10473 [Sphaeroforma arctica JP610]KNC77059.1 hypothetical protein SARC_10473 [Sphaeroforma arctica JP610]|eukprot:XP_014150961.1 hypothetical protein SARC_10473 [Sphaeroforma arctica JP610]
MGFSVPINRRDIGGTCSSDYSYFNLDCPVTTNNCEEGFNANAFYQNFECICVCRRDERREASVTPALAEVANSVQPIQAPTRRDNGGSCSSDYNYWGVDSPVDSDNCSQGYHASASYDYGHSECTCECVQD